MDYAVVQIGSRQYLAKPGKIIEIDKLQGEEKNLACDKVLVFAEGGKVEIGTPFLNKTLNFEILGNFRGPKIRVATYKAKANTRKVKGQRLHTTRIKLAEEKKEKKVTKAVKKS